MLTPSIRVKDVPLADLRPSQENNRALLRHWRGLRLNGDGVPRREAFDPRAVRQLASNMMLLQRSGPDLLTVRLIGSRLVELYGRDPTGENLLALIPEPVRAEAGEAYNEALDLPAVCLAMRKLARASGIARIVEILHMPLRGPERVEFVLSSMWVIGVPFDAGIRASTIAAVPDGAVRLRARIEA